MGQTSTRLESGSLSREDAQLSAGEFFDRYTITGARGQLFTIDLRSEEFDTFLQVHPTDEQGDIVESESWHNDDFEDSQSHSRLELELPADGTYVVLVTSYEGKETGAYELAITTHSGRVETGSLSAKDAQLNTGEFVDTFELTANAGEQIVVDLHSDDFDTYLFIRSADDDDFQIDNDDHEASQNRSQIVLDAPQSGTYVAYVTSYAVGETGAYRLSISNPLPSETARREESGELAKSDDKLDTGEFFDLYEIEAAAGDDFVIDLFSDDFDTYLFVRSESVPDLELDNDDFDSSTQRSQVSLTAPRDGVYRVYVTSFEPGETGAYRLTIDGGGREAGAPAASPSSRSESGELAAGDATLESGEYYDVHEFEGRPGQRARIRLSSSEFDPYLILIDPLGEAEENDDFEGQTTVSQIDRELSELGTYRVAVTSYKAGETGRYELLLEINAASPEELGRDLVRLEASGERSGRLEEGDLRADSRFFDQYAFSASAGQRVVVGMKSGEFDSLLILTFPDGSTLEFDDTGDSRDALMDIELTDAGRYRLAATSYSANAGGAYTLDVDLHAGGAPSPPAQSNIPVVAGRRVLGVFVGISDYPGDDNDLLFCDDDARTLQDIMRRQFNMRDEDSVLLLNEGATVNRITDALTHIGERAGPEDLLLFFYSGHGYFVQGAPDSLDPDGRHETISVYDGDIVDDDFAALVNSSAAGNCMVVLDSCLSGGFQKDFVSAPGRFGLFSSEEVVLSAVAAKFRAGGYLSRFFVEAVGEHRQDADDDGNRELTAAELSEYIDLRYEEEVRSTKGGAGVDYIDLGNRTESLSRQNLVTGWGGMAPNQVLFRWE